MENNAANVGPRDAELAFLRKGWWLFPVLGLLCSCAVGGPFWRWVEGADPFVWSWSTGAGWRAAGFALGFTAVPAVWLVGLRMRSPKYAAMGLALLAVLAAEILLRTPRAQTPFWLAARARLAPDQYFMNEVCYVRLEAAAGRETKAPAVVLVGSSQMLNGVDEQLLRRLLEPMPVIRRSMYGLTPLKALAMLAYIPFQPGDSCVQYLSEFDFTNQDEFPCAWFRPYASWSTGPAVVRSVAPAVRVRNWRQLVDYALAATFESWRFRDFARQLSFQFWRRVPATAGTTAAADPALTAAEARGPLRPAPAERQAFPVFARQLADRQVKLVVFEGDVNPAIHSPARQQAKAEIRAFLAGFTGTGGYHFVSRPEQELALGPECWKDMTHLNATGRELLTRRIAREFLQP